MSDNYRYFIPADPQFVPTRSAGQSVQAVLKTLFPDADEIEVDYKGEVEFIAAAGNFENIRCPNCNAKIDIEWWHDAMDEAWKSVFEDLTVTTPCCSSRLSLNDLDYDWPQGFARFSASVLNGNRDALTPEEFAQVEDAAGCRLRPILAHY